MQWDTQATICAIASGPAAGARGTIRISGPESLSAAAGFFGLTPHTPLKSDPAGGESLKDCQLPTRQAGWLHLPPPLGTLPASLWLWPTTRSYTGQPACEVHTLGCLPVLESALEQLLTQGLARLAEPGEFTWRAFLAGRLDLTQCEAVLGVIHARGQRGLEVALEQLAGNLSTPLSRIRQELIELLADLEAGLDFVDQDIQFVPTAVLIARLEQITTQIRELQHRMSNQTSPLAQPSVTLAGLPNAGKSSLVNALVGSSRNLVSPEAGTTRDYIRTPWQVDQHAQLLLVDTAGLEEVSPLGPRRAAQQQTRNQLTSADLILWCIDPALPDEQLREALSEPLGEWPADRCWLVATKLDQAPHGLERITQIAQGRQPVIGTSCLSPNGLEPLIAQLRNWWLTRDEETASVVPATAARCVGAFHQAEQALLAALGLARRGEGEELVADQLRQVIEVLGVVAGQVCTDDILDALFSRFCIGK